MVTRIQQKRASPPTAQASQALGYLRRTHRPLYCLAFLAPMLVAYELGRLWVNVDPAVKSSYADVLAFVWVQRFLGLFGAAGANLPMAALSVVAIFLAWHIACKDPWKLRGWTLAGMAVESVLMAVPLVVLNQVLQSPFRFAGQTYVVTPVPLAAELVTSVGAGIYEELLFRLVLISLCMFLFADVFKVPHGAALLVGIFVSGALFAGYHHFAEPFTWFKFTFRAIAGIYFAVVFVWRGFGVVVGAHAVYDIVAAVMNHHLLS